MSPNNLFQSAVEQHRRGDLAGAENTCRKLLHSQPRHADALHLLAILLAQTSRLEEAVEFFRQALALGGHPVLHNNLGEAYRQLDRLDEAAACFREALRLAPQFAEAHFNLANTLKAQGRHDDAIAGYRRALELRSGYAKAHYNLANTLREEGRVKEAVAEYRNALTLRPDWRDAHLNLGNAYHELRDLDAAIACYRRVEELAPNDPDIDASLGNAYLAQGRVAEAVELYRKGMSRRSDGWLGRLRVAALCEVIAPNREYLDEYRARLIETLDQLHAEERAPLDPARLHTSGAEPPMALVYHGRDDLALRGRYAALFADAITPVEPRPGDGKPSVGVVVTHGHEGVFAECMGGVVEHLDPARLRVSIVCSRSGVNVLRRLLRRSDLEYLILPERVDQAAEMLRQARFDLLHYWEIGTDSTNYFLPFYRPAPLQGTCWGWPTTSGNPRVDFFLSSALIEPDDGDRHWTEKLVRLGTLPTFYRRPPVPAQPRGRDHFGLGEQEHVYLCTQNLRKVHPDFDPVLRDLLQADPVGRLLLIADEQPHVTELLLGRLRRTLGDACDRVRVMPRMEKADYLSLIVRADVVLDTIHYTGGANTSCDAFAAGTPVVTLPGPYHRGRYTTAAYHKLGVHDLIATSPEDYVRLAVRVATEADYRRDVSGRIRDAAEVLFEDRHAVREHEEFYLRTIEEMRSRASATGC